jgi:hypothetical protein
MVLATCANALERKAIARTFFDETAQPLRERDARIVRGERRQRGKLIGDARALVIKSAAGTISLR